jgi:hypothetical protein
MVSTAYLAREADPCCVLDASLRFVYCNPAWDQFGALNNGTAAVTGAVLHRRPLLEFVPEVIRPFFESRLRSLHDHGCVWYHRYQCCSPDQFRLYELQALNLADTGEILIYHSRILERPHVRIAAPTRTGPTEEGRVRMCCNCRRVGRWDDPAVWDWIPRYVASPPAGFVSDLCPGCAGYYGNGSLSV